MLDSVFVIGEFRILYGEQILNNDRIFNYKGDYKGDIQCVNRVRFNGQDCQERLGKKKEYNISFIVNI